MNLETMLIRKRQENIMPIISIYFQLILNLCFGMIWTIMAIKQTLVCEDHMAPDRHPIKI